MSLRYDSDSFDESKSEINNLLNLLEDNLSSLKEAREIIEEFESKAINKVIEQIEEFEGAHNLFIEEVETIKSELQNIDDVSIDKLLPKIYQKLLRLILMKLQQRLKVRRKLFQD